MRNWRSCFCANGFYFAHGKKKGHWRKREGLSWEWIGGSVQSTFAERETKKKRDVYSMFLLLLGYHKCIATPISHA